MCTRYLLPLFVTFILLIISGCKKNDAAFQRQLDEAEVLMRTNADSAFRQLCALDGEAEKQSKELQMRHLLLRCNAQNKADSLFSSDSLGLTLTRYYADHGTPNQRVLAHYVLGCAYRDMKDKLAAQTSFNNAIAAADTTSTSCDFYQLSIVYGQLGGLFCRLDLPSEALEAYARAERYATQLHDTLGILNIWANKSNAYIRQGRIKEALKLKEKAADKMERLGYRRDAARTRGLCIDWLAEQGNLEKAKAYMDDYERYSGYFLENGDIRPNLVSYYETKGFYFLKAGSPDSAEYYYRKLIREAKTDIHRKGGLWGLYQLYRKLGNVDSVAKYLSEYERPADNEKAKELTHDSQQNQYEFNYKLQEQDIQKKGIEVQKHKLLALILFCILVGLYVLYRKKSRKVQKQTAIITSYQEQTEEQTAKIDSYQKHEKEQDAIIASYQESERKRKNALNENRLLRNETVLHFKLMAEKNQEVTDPKKWAQLKTVVEMFYPAMRELSTRFGFNTLECRICQLLKLGFDLYEIKVLTGTDNKGFSAKRNRMFGKILNQKDKGSAEGLDNYINSIELHAETLPLPKSGCPDQIG